MAHPNEDLIRQAFAAYARRDIQAMATEFFAPDIVWHVPGRSPLAGDHVGQAEVGALFGRLAELSGGTHRVEVHDVLANDDHVVALHAARAERAGKQLDVSAALVFHVRDGKVAEAWILHHDVSIFDDFLS